MFQHIAGWLKTYESFAIWLEGIALVAIFFLDWREYRKQGKKDLQQHEEAAAQMDIWRKQIHADRVAEIFQVLRRFEHFIVDGVHFSKTVGPGRDFSEHGNLSANGGKIFKEYLDLQEAYYLSYLVSDALAAYMKERMAEADGLQRVPTLTEFQTKLQEFHKNWDVYKMAARIREIS
ncbi:MAG: hypothetical protein ACYDD2_07950 [Candidatus Acidiferrales bacterium]